MGLLYLYISITEILPGCGAQQNEKCDYEVNNILRLYIKYLDAD
jgi:hypothetical protein